MVLYPQVLGVLPPATTIQTVPRHCDMSPAGGTVTTAREPLASGPVSAGPKYLLSSRDLVTC